MTKRVLMISTTNGAPDPGTFTYQYDADEVYDITDRLAEVFVQWGYAELAPDAADADVAKPGGVAAPETEDARREREARALGISAPAVTTEPAAVVAVDEPAPEDAPSAATPPVDLSKASRAQLDAAAQAIGVDSSNLPNKDAVRAAIAAAQGD